MFSIFKFIKKDSSISNFEKVAQSKRLCVVCYQPIGESKIKGIRRTKKQTYNYLKARYLDGQIRCQECMIEWFQSKIDDIK